MFKYLRTLNTEFHPTVVEVVPGNADEGAYDIITAGTICSMENGYPTPFYDTSRPLYLALTGKEEDEDKPVKCMRISNDMVFEADLNEEVDRSKLKYGTILTFGPQVDSFAFDLTYLNNSGRFEIIDNSNIDNNKITVVKF